MMINTRSIRFRLIAWYSGLIIVVAVTFGVLTYRDIAGHLLNSSEVALTRRIEGLSREILVQYSADDIGALSRAIDNAYSPEATDRFIRISDGEGKVIYLSSPPSDLIFEPERVPIAQAPGTRWEPLNGNGLYIVTADARLGDRPVRIEMGTPITETNLALSDLQRSLFIGLPLVAFIVTAGGYVLVARSLKPVEQLSATAQEITFKQLDTRLPVIETGDEIEHLSVRLNKMIDRLAEAYHQASRFSVDASHELRTPLAIIRAELESLLRQWEDLPANLVKRIGSVLEETERISFITESLFALSRLEAGEAKIRNERLDLATLVTATVDQMRLLTEDKNIALSVRSGGPVFVQGDSARLKQLFIALLDNAVKYTPEHGSIIVTVNAEASLAVLKIEDTGIGMAAEDMPRIFERFWRADKARSRRSDGAGLGLPIARSICQAHGGTIDVQSVEGKGTICYVRIPLTA